MNKINKHFLALLLGLCSSLAYASSTDTAPQEIFYDLFPGTIQQENDQLILHRCTSGETHYLLNFNHRKDEKAVRTLLKKYPKFWLNLSASAFEKDGQYYLTVERIAEKHLGQSCHLQDALSDLENLFK